MYSFTLWFINERDAESVSSKLTVTLPAWQWETIGKPQTTQGGGWTVTVRGKKPCAPQALPGLDGGDLAHLGSAFSHALGHLKHMTFPKNNHAQ